MDREIRESRRLGNRLRTAVLLKRAGRHADALDDFEDLWRAGGESAEAAGEHLLETLLELEPGQRLAEAARLEALGREGLEGADSLWRAWFPAASNIVGASPGSLALRAFLYEHAASSQPVLLYGEVGTGHSLAARSLHALSGRERLHEVYAPGSCRRLQGELDEVTPGSTVYLSYASEVERWQEQIPPLLAAQGARLVIGMNVVVPPPLRLAGERVPTLELVPLRERLEDLPALVVELLCRAGAAEAAETLPERVLEDLARHDWPGNVRELANHVARAVRRASSPAEVADHLVEDMYGLPGAVG